MSAHTIATVAATQMLTQRAIPLLQSWDDCVFHSDALAGCIDRDDKSEVADLVRGIRRNLSDVATNIERGLELLRIRTARDTNLAANDLPSVAWLLKHGERR